MPSDHTPAASKFTLGPFSVDEPHPIKVVVIGAGYSGIIAAIRGVHILLHAIAH